MVLYIFIFVVVLLIYLFLKYRKTDTESIKKRDTPIKTCISEAVSPPQEHDVVVGYKSPMKYYFYPIYIFHSKESLELYKNIIVAYAMIEEPFHTTFVHILLFLDKNDDFIKSNRTQEFKLKIRNSGEKGSAYLVYSIKELIFGTLLSLFQDTQSKYGKHTMQALLLATAFVHMQKMRQWQYLTNEIQDEVEQCTLVAQSFMKNETWQREYVFQMIKKIKEFDEEFSFINFYFESAKRFAKEYPYVEHHYGAQKLLPRLSAITHAQKSLYAVKDFDIQKNSRGF